MQFLISELSDHQIGLTEIRNDVDSLSELIEIWTDATFASTNSSERDSLQALVGSTLPIGDSLMNVIHLLDSTFRASILDSISVLVSRNDVLDDTEWYTWFEKRYNEIVLDLMAGTEPDSAALADLRTMAQSCFADGGRAVLSARGLSEVLLKEYNDEDTCDPITEERSTEYGYPVQSPVMRISPNPVTQC